MAGACSTLAIRRRLRSGRSILPDRGPSRFWLGFRCQRPRGSQRTLALAMSCTSTLWLVIRKVHRHKSRMVEVLFRICPILSMTVSDLTAQVERGLLLRRK